MIKLQSLINLYWWMDPDGKTHRVPESGHSTFGYEYLASIGKYKRGVNDKIDVFDEMLGMGWLRVCLVNYKADHRVITVNQDHNTIGPNRKQKEALEDLAFKYGASEIVNHTKKTRIEIDENVVLTEMKRIPVVVGIIDTDGKILSKFTTSSHGELGYHYGTKWRYNPETKKVYWASSNWSDQTKDNITDVENYLHKKYGYKVDDNVDMSNLNFNDVGVVKTVKISHGIMTEAKLRGEWWLDNHGQATFADGDVGDVNHEGVVIDYLTREFLEYFDIQAPDDGSVVLGNYEDQIKQHLIDEGDIKTDNDSEDYDNDPAKYMLRVLEERQVIKDKKQLSFAFFIAYGTTQRDAREYALIYWKWKRVKGEWVETWNLTSEDMKIINQGLWDAYGEELGQEDEEGSPTFNVEVRSNNTRYYDIPIEEFKSGNPMSLFKYRNKTDIAEEKTP